MPRVVMRRVGGLPQPDDHQHLVDIGVADLQRARLHAVCLEAEALVEPPRAGIGGADAEMHLFEAGRRRPVEHVPNQRSEEHTSELQSLMRIAYAVFCFKPTKSNYRSRPQLITILTCNNSFTLPY